MADVVDYRFRLRRGLAATWTALDDVLLAGEFGLETDTNKLKIGDGVTGWNSLSYWAPGVLSIVAGANVEVDDTDPANPIVSATSGGGGGGGSGSVIVHPDAPTPGSGQTVTLIDDLMSGLDGSWTTVNANSASGSTLSFTSTSEGLLGTLLNATPYSQLAVLRSLPGGSMAVGDAFYFRVRFCSWNGTNYNQIGIALTDGLTVGSGTQLEAVSNFMHATQLRVVGGTQLMTSFTARSTWVGDIVHLWSPEIWVRLVKTAATTYRTDISDDGRFWQSMNSLTNGTAFAYVGFFLAAADSSGVGLNVLVSHFGKMTGVP
jgi:hypothetical protein